MRGVPLTSNLRDDFLYFLLALEILPQMLVGRKDIVAVYEIYDIFVVGMEDDEIVHLKKGSLLLLAIILVELLVCLILLDLVALDLLDLENWLRKVELKSDKHLDDLDIRHSED